MQDRYQAQTEEELVAQLWSFEQPYAFKKGDSRQTFSIDTPPPTVSGSLHIGHIFSYLHTDFTARYKRMRGFNVFYPMGFDDNGLPTEKFVEKKRSISSRQMTRKDFVRACIEECHQVEGQFKALWQKVGLSVDWNYCYSTISPQVQKVSQASFLDLWNKKLVYRKQEPSLFCTEFQTTVAQAELEVVEKATNFVTIKFGLEQSDEDLLIATTRPELLSACVVVFFHPDDERYQHLVGRQAISPVYGKQVPLLSEDTVDPSKGTGLVMCCTFGDSSDVLWYKKHNLPLIQAIGLDGRMLPVAGDLAGLKAHQAREKIIQILEDLGLLVEKKAIVHNVHVYERSKKEIEYMVLTQWFINILDHKDKFLELGEKLHWTPNFMHARYRDWVHNLSWDWCISRQRFYGISIPVWHCANPDCRQILPATLDMLPVDPVNQPYPLEKCFACGGSNISGDADVMDTWATSSLTPMINADMVGNSTAGWLPMSLRPQAHDIIRTWAFYTIVRAWYQNQSLPWNSIYLSGHVLAGKEKISKSKENEQFTPQSLLQNFSADAIRFWSAKCKLGADTIFTTDQVKIGQRLVTKLWNACKFGANFIRSFDPVRSVVNDNDLLTRWLFERLNIVQAEYFSHFDSGDHAAALEIVERFFWHDFCDNYLEIVKDQVFNPDKYGSGVVQNLEFCLHHASFAVVQMYSPFVPFVCEKIYQELFARSGNVGSLHATNFMSLPVISNVDSRSIDQLIVVLTAVRKLKSLHQLSLKTEIAILSISCADDQKAALQKVLELLAGVTKAREVVFQDSIETDSLNFDGQKVLVELRMAST